MIERAANADTHDQDVTRAEIDAFRRRLHTEPVKVKEAMELLRRLGDTLDRLMWEEELDGENRVK